MWPTQGEGRGGKLLKHGVPKQRRVTRVVRKKGMPEKQKIPALDERINRRWWNLYQREPNKGD